MSKENTNFKNICSVSLKLQMQPSEVFARLQKFLNPTKSGPIESPKIFELLLYIFFGGGGDLDPTFNLEDFFLPNSRHYFKIPPFCRAALFSLTRSTFNNTLSSEKVSKVFCPPPTPQKNSVIVAKVLETRLRILVDGLTESQAKTKH